MHMLHRFLAAVVTSVGVEYRSVLMIEREGSVDSVVGETRVRVVVAVTRMRRQASIATGWIGKCMMSILVIAGLLLKLWSDGGIRIEAEHRSR